MATVAALLGARVPTLSRSVPQLPAVGSIGIELELEGLTDWPTVAGWRMESDGSLRDGIEYVFDGPQSGAVALNSIQRMAAVMATHRPEPSFRCSTHIHVDVRDLEMNQLELMVLAYVMTESVLFDHCSPERRYSNFCPPFFVNTQLARQFTHLFHAAGEDHRKFANCNAWPKYSAFNLKPITNYGSVEFRGSHALLSEEGLLGLAQRVLHLKRLAVEHTESPLQFVTRLRNMSLAELFPTGLREGYAPQEDMMDQCYSSALGIASGRMGLLGRNHEVAGWGRPEHPLNRYQDVMIRMDAEAMQAYGLFPTGIMRLSAYMRMVDVIRRAHHGTPPNMWTFLARQERPFESRYEVFGGSNNIVMAAQALNIPVRNLGL